VVVVVVVVAMPVTTERDGLGLDLDLAGAGPSRSDRRAFLAAASLFCPAVVGVARSRLWLILLLLSSSPDDSSSEDESHPERWPRRRFLVEEEEEATPGVVVAASASPSPSWGAEFSEEEFTTPVPPMALTTPAPPQCIRGRDPGRWEKMVRVAVGRGWPSTVGLYLDRWRTETGGSRTEEADLR